jgi:hemolysin III
MSAPFASRDRPQTPGEEFANSVSHGIALLLAVAAVPVLVAAAIQRGATAGIVGASIFAGAMILLYLTSTIYHALPRNRAKRVLQVLDHAAIFVLIAGTYTPFTLGVLRGPMGWTIFGLVWGLSVAGIALKALAGVRFPVLSIALYLTTGWLAVIATGPLVEALPISGLFWLIAGGVAYTLGVLFFLVDRLPYCHFIWHLFVMAGTACHFVAVLHYAA